MLRKRWIKVKFIIQCFEEVLRWGISLYILAPFLYIFLVYIGALD